MVELITPQEAAKQLKVTDQTIRKMIKTGKIEAYKVGGRWRIEKTEITKLLKRSRIKA
ncbi:MAG: helix-turn-helix domain-containing protein [Archaeoglobus sp.]|uniref:helix-turn-helix domain-containing protein n=1 Tax=Archaeoglobus sp. TaxID=1872626 RepID=UPI001D352D11|nr:helix-turn-helix domain-containing protein [Archaeoglobus sp.]MBO8181076.1 helix-turn-helix domain-containing protein [Archaeoglobus sp.]